MQGLLYKHHWLRTWMQGQSVHPKFKVRVRENKADNQQADTLIARAKTAAPWDRVQCEATGQKATGKHGRGIICTTGRALKFSLKAPPKRAQLYPSSRVYSFIVSVAVCLSGGISCGR